MTAATHTPTLRFSDHAAAYPVWQEQELGAVLDYQQPGPYIVDSTEYRDEYPTPVLTPGKTFVLGYTDETDGIYTDPLPIILFDDFTTASQFVDFPFKVKSSASKILQAKSGMDPRVAYELLQRIPYVVADHRRHWIGEFQELAVWVPSPAEQQKIGNFLTQMDAKKHVLRQKITALERYKKAVMQQLFTQRVRFGGGARHADADWQTKPLGKLANITTGDKDVNQGNPQGRYPFFTCARQHTYSDEYSFSGEAILIAGNGEVGQCTYYTGEFEAYQRTYVLQDFTIDGRYLFMYLATYFQDYARGQKQMGAMPYIKRGMLDEYPVPVPPKDELPQIVDFLTAIDVGISLQRAQLRQFEQFAKGLTQRMFIS